MGSQNVEQMVREVREAIEKQKQQVLKAMKAEHARVMGGLIAKAQSDMDQSISDLVKLHETTVAASRASFEKLEQRDPNIAKMMRETYDEDVRASERRLQVSIESVRKVYAEVIASMRNQIC